MPVKQSKSRTTDTSSDKAPRKTGVKGTKSVATDEVVDDKPAKKTATKRVKLALDETVESDDACSKSTRATRSSKHSQDSKITQMYQKMEHREHVIARPDSYVGKTALAENEMYVYENDEMTKRTVQYVPALFKIFDEGLVNMRDHAERMRQKQHKQDLLKQGRKIDDDTIDVNDVYRQVKSLKVDIDPDAGTISMENDGNGIDVVLHEKEGIYVPQMIFFTLLSGTNFNDNEERTWGGRNGYGSKLISIFSTECTIETVDSIRKLRYRQTCRDNMSVIDKPTVERYRGAPYTRLTFKPDLKIFKMRRLDDYDHMPLMHKRVIDIAACTDKTIAVAYNGEKVAVRDFEKYVDLYLGSKRDVKRVKLQPNDRWEVYVGLSQEGQFQQTSFVNGVATTRGGQHVEHVSSILAAQLTKTIKESKKQVLKDLKPQIVKNCLWVFVNSTIINPDFDNQMKDCLTTVPKEFGSKFDLPKDDVTRLVKLGLVDSCIQMLTEKSENKLEKTGGRKARIRDEKSIVAKHAGTAKASECILILTEGDSAKTLAVSGLGALEEEQRYFIGIMPLSGKIINVKKAKPSQILKNKEYMRIINMMGLKPGMTDFSRLNYGHIAVMTDADHDGYHIKGLLFNMFHRFWPQLLKRDKFFLSIRTPIVKITKKAKKSDYQYLYSYVEFDEWQKANREASSAYEYTYYKGLGTHDADEAREIFKRLQYIDYKWENDLSHKWLEFTVPQLNGDESVIDDTQPVQLDGGEEIISDSESDEAGDDSTPNTTTSTMTTDHSKVKPVENIFRNKGDFCEQSFKLAFEDVNKMSDHRKDWLFKYIQKKAQDQVDYSFQKSNSVNYFDFINSEFIEFSVEDCYRSLPNLMDGFKPSQRKIMYVCLKKRITKKVKVEQLAGDIGKCNYHHGQASLNEAIVLLAQDYVGSNNLNLLAPSGQFGTRVQNGDDHASPRYIFTHLNPVAEAIFDRRDVPLLRYIHDEGKTWEPEFYLPVIPLVLVNGARGIGTGWSTDIPSHSVSDIVANIRRHLKGEKTESMNPCYRGFQGKIEKISSHRYKVTGQYHRDDDAGVVTVTELPVGAKNSPSFEGYKNYLESLLDQPTGKRPNPLVRHIKDVECYYTDVTIDARVTFKEGELAGIDEKSLEKLLKLSFNVSTANMNLYLPDGTLKHYNDTCEILEDFLDHRMTYYGKRKEYMLKKLREECEILSEKARFINYEIDDDGEHRDFTVRKKRREEVLKLLRRHKFKTMQDIQGDDGEQQQQQPGDEIAAQSDGEGEDEGNDSKTRRDPFEGYGYLVKMPILNQTAEMVDRLNQERETKLSEIQQLEATTTGQMYSEDLDRFETALDKFETAWKSKDSYKGIYDRKGLGTRKAKAKRTTTTRNRLKP